MVKFDEDPLRILRCIRFAARFAWEIAPETYKAMCDVVPRMEILTPGRISEEFMKMLSDGHPEIAMRLLGATGAMRYVIPIFESTYDMAQNKYHFGTVWDHTLAVLEHTARLTDDVYVRLAFSHNRIKHVSRRFSIHRRLPAILRKTVQKHSDTLLHAEHRHDIQLEHRQIIRTQERQLRFRHEQG